MGRKVGWILGLIAVLLFGHLWWRSSELGPFTGDYLVRLQPSAAIAWNLFLMALFAVSHSVFASKWFKRRKNRPSQIERRIFLILNFIVVAFVWMYWAPLPEPVLWHFHGFAALPFYAVQLTGLFGFLWTARHFHLPSFFGEKPDTAKLEFKGPFALCRHPSYFFGSLLLVTPHMPAGRALIAVTALAYMMIGSRLEERKLLSQYGDEYAKYRARTPWFIPKSLSKVRNP